MAQPVKDLALLLLRHGSLARALLHAVGPPPQPPRIKLEDAGASVFRRAPQDPA